MVVAEQTDGHIAVVLQKLYGVSMLTTTWLVYGINWARMILLNNPQSVQYALRMLAPTVRIFLTHFSVNISVHSKNFSVHSKNLTIHSKNLPFTVRNSLFGSQ